MTAPPPDPSSSNPREFEAWEDIPDLNPQLMRGIYGYGFEKPSPIQQKSILSIMDGRDVIAQAQSGSGKTGDQPTVVIIRRSGTDPADKANVARRYSHSIVPGGFDV